VDSDAHRRLAARKVIAAKEAGYDPVVVVSAIGRKGAPYATDTLVQELKQIDPAFAPNPREMDMMMACGELISTAVMATTLQSMGYPAVALSGGEAGITTDDQYGNARIISIHPHLVEHAIERGLIPVVCGFQGVAQGTEGEHGGVTTLGRGGSDTTGSALGAALNAEGVEIYTDVDGVKTADPSMVANTKTLDICSYEEVAEMAHLGAKVVHPRAAEIAMDYGIPLWVKSTFTDHPGTRIVAESVVPEDMRQRITGVTHTGKIVFIRLEIENEEHKSYVEQEVYRLMARAGINIFLVSFSPTALSFAISRDDYHVARDLLDGMIVPVGCDIKSDPASTFYIFKFSEGLDLAYSAQRPLLKPVEKFIKVVDVPGSVFENGTMVSVVAARHRLVPGVMAAIYNALHTAKIQVHQVADSDMSISFLVAENDASQAVRLLHNTLGLGNNAD
jgi:aspartate kinase